MIEKKLLIALQHGNKIDVLINNAGNMYRGQIEDLEEQKLLDIFNTNVISGMMLLGKAKKYLAKTKGSNIFIGSVHNRRAFPGASPYAATKGALETLTKVLAAELGSKKIRVNCVVPGGVFTEINQRAGLFDDDAAKKIRRHGVDTCLGKNRNSHGNCRSYRVFNLCRMDNWCSS